MFSFKSIALILAAATAVVTAIPTNAGAGLAKRVAEPAPIAEFAHVARVAAPVAHPELVVRGGPTTIPDCISKCQSSCAPILAQIDADVKVKVDVSVYVDLFLQIVAILKVFVTDCTALLGGGSVILGGLSLTAIANLFVALILSICVHIQACVNVLAVVDLSVFLSVFVSLVAEIVACVDIIVKVCVGINVILDVALVACVNILLALCVKLSASATVVASIKGLLLL